MRYFTAKGYVRLGGPSLPGRPDLVFPGRRTVIFMDGCFWHGCSDCHDIARSCNKYWQAKIVRTRVRDARTTKVLEDAGWSVIRVWEHELQTKSFSGTVRRLLRRLG